MPILALVNFICVLAAYSFLAYALARLRWQKRGVALVLFAIVLCGQIWLIPQTISTVRFAWDVTLYPLWFGNWLGAIFSIVLFSQFLRSTSRDLADAGRLDGFGPWRIFRHVVFPLVRRELLFIAVFILMASWTVFFAPLLARSTLPALSQLQPALQTGINLPILIVASLVLALPLISIFFLCQRDLLHDQRLETPLAQ